MSNRLRRKTRPQADVELFGGPLKQKSFSGGMNLDRPASEIGENQVALAENVICFDSHVEARPGTQRVSYDGFPDNANFTGTYHSACANPFSSEDTSNGTQYLIHRGSRLFKGNNALSAAGEILKVRYDLATGNTLGVDQDSMMRPASNGVVLFTKSGLFLVKTKDGERNAFLVNAPNPVFGVPDDTSAADTFIYRYLVTFSRIVTSSGAIAANRLASGAILEHESGNNDKAYYSGGNQTRNTDYATVNKASAISSSSGVAFSNAVLKSLFSSTSSPTDNSAAVHFTHVSFYRCLDQGDGGKDPVTGQGNNGQLFIWDGDVKRSDIFVSAATYSDTVTDDDLRVRLEAGGFLLKTRGFQPLPSGACGEVTPGFMFVADRETAQKRSTVSYCQLSSPETIGYYFPGSQYKIIKDTITAMRATQDVLSIFCLNSTHSCTLTAFTDNQSAITAIFTLTHFTTPDETLGVRDWGTIAQVDKSTLIAVCSDYSVRTWDTTRWGEDLSYDAVNTEIRKIVPANPANVTTGSSAEFNDGAYLLFYSKNSSDTYLSNVLRYGFGGRAGQKWSSYTSYVRVPFRTGLIKVTDGVNRVPRLLACCVSSSGSFLSGQVYQLETYNTYTGAQDWSGSTLARRDADGYTAGFVNNEGEGTDIACKLRLREMVASEEADTLVHRETHTYFRPMIESTGYRSGFQVSLLAYVDGNPTAINTISNVPKRGDLHFTKEVAGSRIQIEIQTTTGQFRLVGVDSHCRGLDKINFATAGDNSSSSSTTGDAAYQLALASNLNHWFTRRDPTRDRVDWEAYVASGTVSLVTGPDSQSESAYSFSNSYFTVGAANYYAGDFSILFAVKTPALNQALIYIDGVEPLILKFTSNTKLELTGYGDVTVSNVNDGSWHYFDITRSGSTVTVRQNKTTKGTITCAGALGGDNVSVGVSSGSGKLFDLRIYSDNLSSGATDYWYDDIVNNAGALTLPQV